MGGEEVGMKTEDQWTRVKTEREAPVTSVLRSVTWSSDEPLR